jgi:hypothetical protein
MTLNRKTLFTWEFISFVLVTAGAWLAEIVGTFTGTQAVLLSAAAAGVTALARGYAKQGADVKNWWETTEFFVAVIGALQVVIAQLNGTISGQTLTLAASGLGFALALSRGLAKNPLVATGLETVAEAAPQAADPPKEVKGAK